jgi:8-oxo-dGTP pyrophosphatase MutT (NUDIX family)
MRENQIRVIALGLIRQDDRLFVAAGYDLVKQATFYRALGGGVEFGETSLAALQREFQEEIQAALTNIEYLGCLENFFTFAGKPGHEIVQLYRCDFVDRSFYQQPQVTVYEGNSTGVAEWISIDRLASNELRLVPEAVLKLL